MADSIHLKNPIFSIRTLADNTIAVLDQHSTLRILDANDLSIIDGFKSKLIHKNNLFGISQISKSGRFTLIGMPNEPKAALFITKERKLHAKLGLHKGPIESVAISDNEQYLATGGTDGRTFVYDTKTASLMFSMKKHRDYVSYVTFSPNSMMIATASFDRTIHVKNIAVMSDEFVLSGHSVRIKALLFVSSDSLISADKEGNVVIWDLFAKRIKKRLPKMNEEINAITVSGDNRFLFVATIFGNIAVYDLEELTQVDKQYLKASSAINAITIECGNFQLVYGCVDGTVCSYNLKQGEEKIQAYVDAGEYTQAYALVRKNVMLKYSSYFEKLETLWAEKISHATELLAQDNSIDAKEMLNPFLNIPGKQSVVKHLIADFEKYPLFKEYVSSHKYNLAYSLVVQYPVYKECKEYKELEAVWEKLFGKAKKAILLRSNESEARELLASFRGISYKAVLINELFNQQKAYLFFRNKLAQKDFKAVFSIVEKHPFLKELKEFKDLSAWSDAIYIKIQAAYKESNYLDAIKLAKFLADFPEFKEEIASLLEHSQIFLDFDHAVKSEDINKAYKLLAQYNFLSDLPIASRLDTLWNAQEQKARLLAVKGDIKGILDVLKDFLPLSYRQGQITLLLCSAYVKQIRVAMHKKSEASVVEKGLIKIYEIFGDDGMVEALIEFYNAQYDKEFNVKTLNKPTTNLYNFTKMPQNILV